MKKIFLILSFQFFCNYLLAAPVINVSDKDFEANKAAIEDIDKIEADPRAKVVEEISRPADEPINIGLVLDSSGSMGQMLEKNKTKMFFLKKMMKEFVGQQWKLRNKVGVRVYGARVKGKCDDIQMITPYTDHSLSKLEKSLETMAPLGMTPMHASMMLTVDEIKNMSGEKKIVIVTDGEDTCGGDPCKTAEKIKKDKLDITFYVIALGFQGNSDALQKMSCLGDDIHMANDAESFSDAVTQVSSKINKNQNLKVISPNPDSPVYLYRFEDGKKKLERIFYAKSEQTVPVGEYEAVVMFKPPYKFSKFKVPPGRKVVLRVEGEGEVTVNFFDSHLRVQILDKNNKVMIKGKSDEPMVVPTGKWKLRIFREPFYELLDPNYYVYPNSKQNFDVYGVGVTRVDAQGVQGVYVYNGENKLIDYTLSGSPFVLKAGVYSIHVNDKCSFTDVSVREKKEVVVLSCPQ